MTPVAPKKFDFIVEYVGESESLLEKALTQWSRAQIECFDEKIVGQTSRNKVPLRTPQNYCISDKFANGIKIFQGEYPYTVIMGKYETSTIQKSLSKKWNKLQIT
jgi:hypothetical protein